MRRKVLLGSLVFAVILSLGLLWTATGQTINTFLTTNLSQVVTAVHQFVSGEQEGPVTYTGLPASPVTGQLVYCSNCSTGNPCASAGSGALAVYTGTAWNCSAAGSSSSFSGGGSGSYFYGPGVMAYPFATYNLNQTAANEVNGSFVPSGTVIVYLFELQNAIAISECSEQANNNTNGFTTTFGIYSVIGNLLVSCGSFNQHTSPTVQTNTFTSTTLPAGVYWQAQATNTASANASFASFVLNSSGTYSYFPNTFGKNVTRFGTAANLATSGPNDPLGNPTTILPATLGTITPFVPAGGEDGPAAPLWE